MSFKKLSRIATVAFVLAVLLAVSAFAYGVDVAGKVTGLEDGVDYTCAQYDFATDAYGEFTELTSSTVLTSGVWGIKAGDAETEAIFVHGAKTGAINFWDETAAAASADYFDEKTKDTYVPGKWTGSTLGTGAFSNSYPDPYTGGSYASVLTQTVREYFLVYDKSTEKNSDNKYDYTYAAFYGDTSETGYKYATTDEEKANFWILGEDNKLQESKVYYGFTNEQVVPTSAFEGFDTHGGMNITGSLAVNENYVGTENEYFHPKLTLYIETLDGGEDTYSLTTDVKVNETITFTLTEDDPAIPEGYIVAFELAIYDNVPDDMLVCKNNVESETSTNASQHIKLNKGDNGFTVTAPTYAAPAVSIVDGKVTGLVAGNTYQYCNVVDGVDGEATALTADTVVYGTIKVRQTDATGEVASEWTAELTSDRKAPTGISFVDGKPVDLETGILYEYINLTVGSAEKGKSKLEVEESTVADLTASSTDIYGLIKIREKNATGTAYTDWSPIILSKGTDTDLINPIEQIATATSVDDWRTYYYDTKATYTNYVKGDTVPAMQYADYEVYAIDKDAYRYSVQFTTGKWGGPGTKGNFGVSGAVKTPYSIAASSAKIPSKALYTAQTALTSAQNAAEADPENTELAKALATAQENYNTVYADFLDALNNYWYSYRLENDEIIPMNEFGSHGFYTFYRQLYFSITPDSGFTNATAMASSYTLVILTEDGKIDPRTVEVADLGLYGAATSNEYKYARKVTLEDFTNAGYSTDGYIVGIIIRPVARVNGTVSGTTDNKGRIYDSDMAIALFDKGYKPYINNKNEQYEYEGYNWTVNEYVPAPEGLDIVDGKVQNLVAGKKYEYVNVEDTTETAYELTASTVVYGSIKVRVYNDEGTVVSDWTAAIPSDRTSAPAITFVDGKPGGLEEGILYQYITLTIGNNAVVEESEETALTASTEAYGLIKVREVNAAGTAYTEWSDIIYSAGTSYSILHTQELVGTGGANNGVTMQVPVVNSVDFDTYRDTNVFSAGMWTGYLINYGLQQKNGYGALTLGTTSSVGATQFANLYNLGVDAQTNQTDEFKAAIADIKEVINDYRFVYAYNNDEIIPVECFESFKFNVRKRIGYFTATGYVKTKLTLVVMTAGGQIKYRDAYKDATGFKNVTHTFTADDYASYGTDGYLVGLIITPYVVNDETVITMDLNSDKTDYRNHKVLYEAPALLYEDGYSLELGSLTGITGGETINGISATKNYEYKSYTINADGTALEASDWTTLDHANLPSGLIAVRELISDTVVTKASDMIYVYGDEADRKDLGTWVTNKHGNDTDYYKTQNSDAFVVGTWTGIAATTHSSYPNNRVSPTGSEYVSADDAGEAATLFNAYVEAKAAHEADPSDANATELANATAAYEAKAAVLRDAFTTKWFGYAYEANEIIPVSEVYSFDFETGVRQGVPYTEPYTSVVKVYVADLEGKVTEHVYTTEALKAGELRSVDFTSDDNWDEVNGRPTNGYLVGIKVYTSAGMTNLYGWSLGKEQNTMAYIDIEGYNILATADAPVIEIANEYAKVTVTNYNSNYTYAYSENGVDWVEFEGDSFNAPKAGAKYVVKVVETAQAHESEASKEVTAPNVVIKGISLVLDGQIAIRYYMDIADKENYEIKLNTTKVNSDDSTRTGGAITFATSPSWASKLTEAANGLYYTDICVAAKDVDNVNFETALIYWTKGTAEAETKVSVGSPELSVARYIEDALGSTDAELVAARPVITMLDIYADYADNYFSTADALDTYTSDDFADATIEDANYTNSLTNLTYVGASLLLEDNVTIRHYFKTADGYTFDAGDYVVDPTTVTVKTKNEGYYVCFDITDIPAHKIGDAYTLTITGAEGEGKADAGKVATVTYSVANYLAGQKSSANAKLVNLVNVMYDYYVEAFEYYDLKH